ncbi:hypothetical protein ACFQAT_14220 [Undibacterium arcticum]|uniref:Uncharacterized protein n=1 Tax=Undibacterium arcticum TaxID=1762892 RepID=A0ABV7F7N1_9BURK
MTRSIIYIKGSYKAEASVSHLPSGKYQGVVLLTRDEDSWREQHKIETASDTSDEAFDEAKALAHRLLANR